MGVANPFEQDERIGQEQIDAEPPGAVILVRSVDHEPGQRQQPQIEEFQRAEEPDDGLEPDHRNRETVGHQPDGSIEEGNIDEKGR